MLSLVLLNSRSQFARNLPSQFWIEPHSSDYFERRDHDLRPIRKLTWLRRKVDEKIHDKIGLAEPDSETICV